MHTGNSGVLSGDGLLNTTSSGGNLGDLQISEGTYTVTTAPVITITDEKEVITATIEDIINCLPKWIRKYIIKRLKLKILVEQYT
jgi:hypothetical protein